MNFLKYIFYCFILSFLVLYISVNIGSFFGSAGSSDIGAVITSISITCGVIITCTIAISDTIKKLK